MAFTPFDLTGKVAVVTGGNGGIGLGMAQGLAAASRSGGAMRKRMPMRSRRSRRTGRASKRWRSMSPTKTQWSTP